MWPKFYQREVTMYKTIISLIFGAILLMSTVAVSEQTPETPNTIEPLQPEQERMA